MFFLRLFQKVIYCKLSDVKNLNHNDAVTQSLSNSIPNDLEDATGKAWLCKPAIRKGQMFLSAGRGPLIQNGGHPPEVTVPPSALGCGGENRGAERGDMGPGCDGGHPLALSQ